MTRVLVGVGVGPGDPELVTVKAVRILRAADVVLVPVMAAETSTRRGASTQHAGHAGHAEDAEDAESIVEPGRAESVVRVYTDRVERVVFALNDRGGVTERRARAWRAAAATVAAAFAAGRTTVAFATIGDPNLYSTFTYLAQSVRRLEPDVTVETVPGITAMQDLAARSGTVLAEGTESLALMPLTGGIEGFQSALESYDTVVAYKFGTVAGPVRAALKEAGRLDDAVYGARLGLPGEDVRPGRELTASAVPYLSTLIVPARRTTHGGRLP